MRRPAAAAITLFALSVLWVSYPSIAYEKRSHVCASQKDVARRPEFLVALHDAMHAFADMVQFQRGEPHVPIVYEYARPRWSEADAWSNSRPVSITTPHLEYTLRLDHGRIRAVSVRDREGVLLFRQSHK